MKRLCWLILFLPLLPAFLQAQSTPSCVAAANPPVVRVEGLNERMGDVLFSCSGGQPNGTITGNFTVFLSVPVTNAVASDGTSDVVLTVNGAPANVLGRQTASNAVTFGGFSGRFTALGTMDLRLQNLRGNANQLINQPNGVITLFASFTGGSLLTFTNSQFTVGIPQRGFLAGSSGKLICSINGSPLPAAIGFANLIGAGTVFASTRVTEGFESAFDNGLRILATYSGFPAGARLFVPDAVAGSDADQPTAGGDLGFPASGGVYSPGRSELLLIRVVGADATGAGGTLALAPPSGTTMFDSVSEAPLTNGAGYVVYQVVDSNPSLRESAQFPTFLGLPPGGSTAITDGTLTLAPAARFAQIAPPLDCTALADCNAGYFPHLVVDAPATLTFPVATGSTATQYIPVRNGGSGILLWRASTTANFLQLAPAQGINNGTVRVDASPGNLPTGTYANAIVIDAGPLAGSRTLTVTLIVTAPVPQPPVIRAVGNAANIDQTTLVAGSLATIFGSKFAGRTLQVTFDGTPATILFSNDGQINVQVPDSVAGKTSSRLVVTVDGFGSAPVNVPIALSAPAVFAGAVLNQDSSANRESAPAAAGTVLQIFATGLPSSGVITAKVHDRIVTSLYYAGPAPGLPGVQQVNVAIPDDLPAMQTWVYVCGNGVCSPGDKLWIIRPTLP